VQAPLPVEEKPDPPAGRKRVNMPNIKSAKKDMKKSRERQLRNKSAKSAVKTAIKKSRVAIESGEAEAARDKVHDTQSLINRTASRGIIHKKAAARRTSRLMKRWNKANAEQ
jgi:small subunit ribosomal protein S20